MKNSFVLDSAGFSARQATVNGQVVDLARYIGDHGIATRLPLVANQAGARVNVSIQSVDAASGEVRFHAPVVPGIEYRQARALGAGGAGVGQSSCNCILNDLYGDLPGKPTGGHTGAATFGEIAAILLNQTLVHMDIRAA